MVKEKQETKNVFFTLGFAACSYIIGSETARMLGTWRWALRVTPFLGILAVILIFLTEEPQRGQSEGSHNLEATSYKEDLIGEWAQAISVAIGDIPSSAK